MTSRAKDDPYIRVGRTARSIGGRPEYKATLYVFQRPICEVLSVAAIDDDNPSGTAIAQLMTKFHQQVGRDIRYSGMVPQPTGRKAGTPS